MVERKDNYRPCRSTIFYGKKLQNTRMKMQETDKISNDLNDLGKEVIS